MRAIFSDPAVKQELSRRGVDPLVGGSPEQLQTFVKNEILRWGEVVQRAGVAGSL